jgi:hypothetical protein
MLCGRVSGGDDCAQYSKLTRAPSLLTGRVTVVGKVVRVLSDRSDGTDRYFDVEGAVTYGRAVRRAAQPVRQALRLRGAVGRDAVRQASMVQYAGLVVLPIAIFK